MGKYSSQVIIRDQNDPSISKTINVVTDISIKPVYAVSASSDVSSSSIEDGNDAVYNIAITNAGNVEDTYELILFNPMADSAVLDDGSDVTLQAGGKDIRQLTVSSSSGTYDVTVIARSKSSSAVSSVKTTTKVLDRDLVLSSDLYSSVSTPYGSLKCTLTVKNTGNAVDSFSITDQTNGTISITPSSIVNLQSGASENIEVVLTGGDVGLYNSTINVVSDNDADAKSSVKLNLNIIEEPVYDFALSMDSLSKKIERTDDGYYLLSVKNTGNRPDTYNISTGSSYADLSVSSLNLGAGESGTVRIDVSGFPDYGTYPIGISVTSQETSETINRVASIAVVPALKISANPASQTIEFGNSSLYKITVTNTGTRAHDYDLNIVEKSSGTDADLLTSTISDLGVGESATVEMLFNNTNAEDKERSIKAVVRAEVSSSPLKNRSVSVTSLYLEEDVFGVTIEPGTSLQSIAFGKSATHLMTVKNLGNTQDNFSVTISEGNATSDVSYLLLEPSGVSGDSRTVVLTHTPSASAGDYPLIVKVGSANSSDSVKYTTRVVAVEKENIISSYVDPTSSVVGSEVHNSSVYNSFINRSVLSDSTVTDSSVINSTIEDSTILEMILQDAYISGNTIHYGTVTIDDQDYFVDPAEYPDGVNTDELLLTSNDVANDLAGAANDTVDVDLEDSNMAVSLGVNGSFVGGEVKVQKVLVPPSDVDSSTLSNVGGYVTFEESENIKEVLSYANISIDYDDSDLGDADEDQLYIYWYNEDSSEWVPLVGAGDPSFCLAAGRDTENNILWATITHFSTYAVGEAEAVTPEEPDKKSSGSSGGGSGGSVSSGESYENIFLKNVLSMYLYKDQSAEYSFTDEQNPIRSVRLTPLLNAGYMKSVVEVLKGTSGLVDADPAGLVYRNVNIAVGSGWASERTVRDASIEFAVEKEWISSNNVDIDDIKLLQYTRDWLELDTTMVSEDDNFAYFVAKTSSFSSFAIVGALDEDAILSEDGVEIVSETPSVDVPADIVPPVDDGSSMDKIIFGLVLFILSIAVIVFAEMRRNK